jgi:hypothetical protein
MEVSISPKFTIRTIFWTEWTEEQLKRRGIYQGGLTDGVWTIWFYDQNDCFLTHLWTGTVPNAQIVAGYTQEQNDLDLSDFAADWQAGLNQPLSAHELDGRTIVASYPANLGTQTQFVGSGDDVVNGLINEGTELLFEFSGPGTLSKELQFLGVIQLADGAATYSGSWDARDRISFGVRMPANVPVPNVTNTGNCNLMPIGPGINMIIPAANGTHDIDLATAIPIITDINGNANSPWWTDAKTGDISVARRNQGNTLLLDVEKTFWLVRKVAIGAADGHWDIDVYRAEFIHPRWITVAEVVKTSSGAGILSGELLIYRVGNLGI